MKDVSLLECDNNIYTFVLIFLTKKAKRIFDNFIEVDTKNKSIDRYVLEISFTDLSKVIVFLISHDLSFDTNFKI